MISGWAVKPSLHLGEVDLFFIDEDPFVIIVGDGYSVMLGTIRGYYASSAVNNIEAKSFQLSIIKVIDVIYFL